MKKNLLRYLLIALLIIPCAMILSACGGGGASASGVKVYIDGTQVSTTNNTITVDYSPEFSDNWKSRISVYELFDNGTEKQITSGYQINYDGNINNANE